ncbi:N-acetylmuramoyl-L-alanine amidase [Cognatilysobacter lacus]|uniref:N-acetylmuramoyl-L-alanine amidase AmiC n=1 Tax=Cognatilysobacter lacus TaxID=1643323 RepID=A0A5D8Z5H2_9GAMM|nr:N-acetylmuramoyl-L-alanine amidase [Lysobacter lacus]TZF90168.1 AMIN domain-containing protein [Lysobacter lacus]
MRVKADTVQKAILGAALLAALVWNLAQAAEIRGVELDRGATGTRAQVVLDATPTGYRVIRLSSPERLVVDLPESSVRRGASLPAPAGVVRAIRYGQPEPGIARIVFELAQPVAALQPRLEPAGNGARLVLEWPGDDEAVASANLATASGGASAARVTQPAVDGLTAAAASRPQVAPESMDAIVSAVSSTPTSISAVPPIASPPALPPKSVAARSPAYPPATISAAPSTAQTSTRSQRDASGRPLRPLVIAIDAGHGGQDPGAHGPNGRREKDVTLAIARELARQVNAAAGYRAYLTRDADFFIPLNERARLAKRAGADMFVSIHADAAENPAARGSSVFVLSLKGASSQRARWLADTENAADLIGGVRVEPGNTLASVLLDLTQSGNLKASEDVAGQVLSGLAQLGPNHKSTVERANFAVLRTSDTPAMLVETAFISNPDEEQRLTDPVQQAAIARAVFGGINSYFVRTPPPGTMLASRSDEITGGSGRTGGSR